MPFSFKNTETTYQRLVNMIFHDLISKTMEVYINNVVVKIKAGVNHIDHLNQVFDVLRKYNINLNPSKFAFVVSSW